MAYRLRHLDVSIGPDFGHYRTTVSSKRVTIEMCDLPGKASFAPFAIAMCKMFAGALVVYDVTNSASLPVAESWLQQLLAAPRPDFTVVLVGNKADAGAATPGRQVSTDDGQQLAPSTAYCCGVRAEPDIRAMPVRRADTATVLTVAGRFACQRSVPLFIAVEPCSAVTRRSAEVRFCHLERLFEHICGA